MPSNRNPPAEPMPEPISWCRPSSIIIDTYKKFHRTKAGHKGWKTGRLAYRSLIKAQAQVEGVPFGKLWNQNGYRHQGPVRHFGQLEMIDLPSITIKRGGLSFPVRQDTTPKDRK